MKDQHTSERKLSSTQRWVIKIGSALITANGKGIDEDAIASWVDQMAELRRAGLEIVLVSSGAVAEGMSRLGIANRPQEIHRLQAAAAVGQMGLVQTYETYFERFGLHAAQILLTHEDLSNRKRYLNARSTITELIALNAVPIINENDTVVTDEIRFGDNDSLAALVANLLDADALVILTDQKGLYREDPRQNPNAELLSRVDAHDPALDAMAAGSKGDLGRGGMQTKLRAARTAARSGATTLVVGGSEPDVLLRLYRDEPIGTIFIPDVEPFAARKQWLASQLQPKGNLVLDRGAVTALRAGGKSLLPVGILSCAGEFKRGDLVECQAQDGEKVARGLVNYGVNEVNKILGQASESIVDQLGYVSEPEVIHCDNLVVIV